MPSITAYERELRAAQREADIERVATLERQLVSLHRESFPKSERKVLPPLEAVDPAPIEAALGQEMRVPDLVAKTGGGEVPPVAPLPEPVDGYELMREFRKARRQGIPFWHLRELIDAARLADLEAEETAVAEEREREAARTAEQARLDEIWQQLEEARSAVARQLPDRVAAEKARRDASQATEQRKLNRAWERLLANDPEAALPALKQAFADNEAPATAIECQGNRTTVVMRFPAPEAIVPERKLARTPTGKRTLKKRTKTEINALYLDALGSYVLATVKETFAVAPGTDLVQLLVVRREDNGKHAGELAAIYSGEFSRGGYENASGSGDPGRALTLASNPMLNLTGQTAQVAPLDLKDRPELDAVVRKQAGSSVVT